MMDSAIAVSGAQKYYGSHHVLNNLDMTAPHGCIYGLLGSSGCGKTTLLRCILGRLQLAEGDIRVLGKPPGSRGHQVPGRDVGYMPQEVGLCPQFTTYETMYYFGVLHGLDSGRIRRRSRFLLDLLYLRHKDNDTISTLSGGQLRMVSLAVAMLHEPQLLILDEPTVGVDPLLRSKIWNHLVELVRTTNITVVMTTHYIEEATQADVIGIMIDGHIKAEAPPNDLVTSNNSQSLEEVFLHMCQNITMDKEHSNMNSVNHDHDDRYVTQNGHTAGETVPLIDKYNKSHHMTSKPKSSFPNPCLHYHGCQPVCICPNPYMFLSRTLALIWKNYVGVTRRKVLLIYQILLPLFQVVVAYYGFGAELTDIDVAVVNHDIGTAISICGLNNNFGSDFISILDSQALNLEYYNSTDEAVDQVKRGKAWAAIIIPSNFSIDMLLQGLTMSQLDIQLPLDIGNRSTIKVYEDMTNTIVTLYFKKELYLSIESYWMKIVKSCNISSPKFTSIIEFHDPPIYGTSDITYTDYIIPGFILSAVFITASIITGLQFVRERNSGLMDRTWATGVGVIEMVIAQLVYQTMIIVIQVTLVALVVMFAFKVYIASEVGMLLVVVLGILQGLTGMSFGLALSSLCDKLTTVNFILTGLYFPILLLSGIIWPVSSMPEVLQYVSIFVPISYSTDAARLIMGKGWGLNHIEVVYGFISLMVWITLLLICALVGLKLKK